MTALWDRRVGGRPVPWVTSWTSEVDAHLAAQSKALEGPDREVRVASLVGQNVDGSPWQRLEVASAPYASVLTRKGGWWWSFYPSKQGEGDPAWADVHARRQRLSMLKHLCQVCARQMPRPSKNRPFEWVLAQRLNGTTLLHGQWPGDGTVITVDAPTCPGCADEAERLCPALRRHSERVMVVAAEPWGVVGETFDTVSMAKERGTFQGGDPLVQNTTVARQLAVALTLAD